MFAGVIRRLKDRVLAWRTREDLAQDRANELSASFGSQHALSIASHRSRSPAYTDEERSIYLRSVAYLLHRSNSLEDRLTK